MHLSYLSLPFNSNLISIAHICIFFYVPLTFSLLVFFRICTYIDVRAILIIWTRKKIYIYIYLTEQLLPKCTKGALCRSYDSILGFRHSRWKCDPAFPKSRISKVMYKARCRRSYEDARGPKTNREILRFYLFPHESYVKYSRQIHYFHGIKIHC